MQNTDLRFSVKFFLGNSPKSMTFTDLKGSPAGSLYDTLLGTLPGGETHENLSGICRFNSPSGIFYSNAGYSLLDFSSPDVDGATDDWAQAAISLPLSGSEVLCGNYSFEYYLKCGLLGAFAGYNALGYFEVTGDYTSLIGTTAITGLKFQITGVNAGTYNITSASYNSGSGMTRIVVSSPPSAFVADVTDAIGVVFFTSNTINYCYERPESDIDVSSSCVFSQLTAEDDSVYVTRFGSTDIIPTVTQAWSISGPTNYSATPVTGTGSPFVIGYGTSVNSGANLWTGAYAVQLTAGLTFNVESWGTDIWFIVGDSIVSSTSFTATCDTCICDLAQCIKNLFDKYVAAMGVNKTESERLKTKLIKVLGNWMLLQMAERCGSDYAVYCSAISDIVLGENCQCATSDTTISREIIPVALQVVAGGGTGSHITFGAGGAGLPASPITGDMHVFNTTAGLYTEGDIYWYNGSSWVSQFSLVGAAGPAGAAGTNGADGQDGASIVFSQVGEVTTNSLSYVQLMASGALTNLSANGDMFVIDALFGTSATGKIPDTIKLMIDGLDLKFNTVPFFPAATVEYGFGGEVQGIRVHCEMTVSDYANKKAYLLIRTDYISSNGSVLRSIDTLCYLVTTSALNNIAISAHGKIGNNGTVNCIYLVTKFLNKI